SPLPLYHTRILSFFLRSPAPTAIYTLSLHDALPIWNRVRIDTKSATRVVRIANSVLCLLLFRGGGFLPNLPYSGTEKGASDAGSQRRQGRRRNDYPGPDVHGRHNLCRSGAP